MIESYSPKTSPISHPKFTLLIPSWNNLDYLKLCIRSIREHSAFEHQIVLHLNGGADGSREWAKQEGLTFTFSSENVGICWAMNAAAGLAKTDYIVYLNDDMYVLPDWDRPLWEEIQRIGHRYFFLSATLIEPRETGNSCVIAPGEYGSSIDSFQEKKLLANYRQVEKADWNGATWPPNVVHRDLWRLIGGYSIEFSPGMSSDPDFSMKLWQAGVRYFKGLGNSRVYHFQAKSTGKVEKNDGNTQFLRKWGMTQSTFNQYYLKRGTPWDGPLKDPEMTAGLKRKIQKSRWKLRFK